MFAQIVSNTFHSLSINPIPGTSSTNTIQEWYKLIKSQVFIPSKQDILHFDQVTWLIRICGDLLIGNSLRLYQVIQCKSEVNEAWLSPAGVFSTVASVASASFCPTSSKRGRHIEAYFPSCQGFHLRKENSHKKPDVFLFPILILILQYPNFLLQGLLTLSKNHSWSPKRPDSLKNCMLASFIEVYLKRKNLGRLKDNLNVQPLTGLP